MPHKLPGGNILIQHIRLHGVDDLPQVVGRGAGGHAHGDALGSVYKEIGDLYRQDGGLFFRLVKIWHKVHHVLVQIPQKGLLGDLLQPCLRITHCRGTVSLNVAEIPVPVHQGQSLLKVLAHNHQRVIDGAVTVGMILTHGIAHDTRALPIRPVIADSKLVHVVKGAPLHGL